MIDLLVAVFCIALGMPMLLSAKKVAESPKSKLKNARAVRLIGVALIVVAFLFLLI